MARMRVLVTFAVEAEFAPWRKLRQFNSIDCDGLQLRRTMAGDKEITALLTGMGRESAAQAMGLMMKMADDNRHFDVCISSGLAGAVQENLGPGDIIAPQMLVAESTRTDLHSDRLEVDAELRAQALAGGAVATSCLLTTDRVVVKAGEKRICAAKAQSVDMESFGIVNEAHVWGARCVVVRAISDVAGEDLPINFNLTMSEGGGVSAAGVIGELMKHPLALPSLVRFAIQSRRAAEKLAKFLDDYIQNLTDVAPLDRSAKGAAR